MDIIKIFAGCYLLLLSCFVFGHGDDDPLLTSFILDRLETRQDNITVIESELWIGKDLQKLWINIDTEFKGSDLEKATLESFYNRAVSPNWDLQVGLRHDFKVDYTESQSWLAFGFLGLAPYFIEMDTHFLLSDGGDLGLQLSAEKELLLTQKLVLIPELSFNLYGQENAQRRIGSGLSSSEFSIRLAYFFKREFAPYIAYTWDTKHGETAGFFKDAGEESKHTSWALGLHFWL